MTQGQADPFWDMQVSAGAGSVLIWRMSPLRGSVDLFTSSFRATSSNFTKFMSSDRLSGGCLPFEFAQCQLGVVVNS